MTTIFSTRYSLNNEEINENKNMMKHNTFTSVKVPKPIWHYSKTFLTWNLVFCSWQIWINPETNEMLWTIEEQTIQACRNIKLVLEEIWLWLKDVVKTTLFLKDINDIEKVNSIYKDYFLLKPARSTIAVSWIPRWALIEIESIAMIPTKPIY